MDSTGIKKPVINSVLFLLMAAICNAAATEFVLEDLRGSSGRVGAPASHEVTLSKSLLKAAGQDQLVLQLIEPSHVSRTIAAQFEPKSPGSTKGKIWWLMPAVSGQSHRFRLSADPEIKRESVSIDYDKTTQQMNITEGALPVLRYNYGTVPMTEEIKERFSKGAYPSPPYDPTGLDRGDYIHPLYGPEGEVLTDDYPVDHPHHRGIYWAWPEVYYKGELRDIHAVFGVWARPVKVERLIDGPVFALIQVENVWMWKNTEPIVKEKVSIRAFKSANKRRFIDLEFSFTGLADGVQIARRGKNAYGGLNFRMAGGDDMNINFFTDPETVPIRRAWADMTNTFKGGRGTTGITILQNMSAPAYPNDWIEYPNVFWFQPGFPPKGQTYKLTKDSTLTLKHRLWIHPDKVTEDVFNDLWAAYNYPPQPKDTLVQYRHILDYKFGDSRKPLIALENSIATCSENGKKQIEAAMLEVINSKQATNDIKHWVCTQLNIIGTDKSVPSMAILLTDKSLCHSARYALDGIRTDLALKIYSYISGNRSCPMQQKELKSITRRNFLKGTTALIPLFVPASALGLSGKTAPSSRITMGFIGVGGKGRGGLGNFQNCPDAQILAVCDVNTPDRQAAQKQARLSDKDTYVDFHDLLARKDIDAIQIASPDHWHVLHAIAAIKAGKDVYCEKPLSNTIAEGRALVETVKRYGAVFQHGTQLRSGRNVRFACELVRNQRIGKLHTITIGSPPGIAIPPQTEQPVPEGFHYDLWQGPAPEAPFTPCRVFRRPQTQNLPGWYFVSDYSKSGWVAGYGVHDLDIAHWGMDTELTGPVEIQGEGVFPEEGLFDTVMTYRLEYKYANGIKLIMTSTDRNPHGVRFQGTDGWVFTRSGIDANPKSLLTEVIKPNEVHLYESNFHEKNFIDCVKSRKATITPAEVAHRSTSAALLGGIALKLRRKLKWNPNTERFVNDPQADRLLSYAMRSPWRL